MTERLDLEAARWVLGLTFSSDLAGLAAEALAAGYDSPSLRLLAGTTPDEAAEVGQLFERALSELAIARPAPRDAVDTLARHVARQIIDEEIRPHEGAKQIWSLTLLIDSAEVAPPLDTFVYAASEYDERPQDHALFDAGVIAAAADLVAA